MKTKIECVLLFQIDSIDASFLELWYLLKVFLGDRWFLGESIVFFFSLVDSVIHFTLKYLMVFHQTTLY